MRGGRRRGRAGAARSGASASWCAGAPTVVMCAYFALAVDTPSFCSIAATEPVFGSKNSLLTDDQPPRSLMVNRPDGVGKLAACPTGDRKSTRLNSSHLVISYAVFCLK